MTSRASPETAEVLAGQLARMPLLAVPRDERRSCLEELDGVCRELAAHRVGRYGPGAS